MWGTPLTIRQPVRLPVVVTTLLARTVPRRAPAAPRACRQRRAPRAARGGSSLPGNAGSRSGRDSSSAEAVSSSGRTTSAAGLLAGLGQLEPVLGPAPGALQPQRPGTGVARQTSVPRSETRAPGGALSILTILNSAAAPLPARGCLDGHGDRRGGGLGGGRGARGVRPAPYGAPAPGPRRRSPPRARPGRGTWSRDGAGRRSR